MLYILTTIVLAVIGFWMGLKTGTLDQKIRLGSNAYFVIYEIRESLNREDLMIVERLDDLLTKMDPKNSGGSPNEAAMRDFIQKSKDLKAKESQTPIGAAQE